VKQVIVRNLRIRDNGFVGRSGADCICIIGSHVLIDHCSLQWARDEVVNPWYETAHDITVQWCIIGPGWGPHGYGFVNGAGADRITLHHNLFPHNRGRNPLICGNSRTNWVGKFANDTPVFDCRNNIAYNWRYEAATITAGAHTGIIWPTDTWQRTQELAQEVRQLEPVLFSPAFGKVACGSKTCSTDARNAQLRRWLSVASTRAQNRAACDCHFPPLRGQKKTRTRRSLGRNGLAP